jgi:N-acetylneuraminic acid mutarotase
LELSDAPTGKPTTASPTQDGLNAGAITDLLLVKTTDLLVISLRQGSVVNLYDVGTSLTIECVTDNQNFSADQVVFEYNGRTQTENYTPWAMAGDTVSTNTWYAVDYLSTPGAKEVKVTAKQNDVTVGSVVLKFTIIDGTSAPTGEWVFKAPLPIEVGELAAASDGYYVYSLSGHHTTLSDNYRKMFRYDPQNDSWMQLADQNVVPAVNHAVVQYVNGKIYQIGGFQPETNEVAIYDIDTNTWSTGAPLTRNGQAYTLASAANGVIDGKIYIAGGLHNNNQDGIEPTTLFVYDPAADTWAELAPMPMGRNHAAGVGYNDKLHVFPGAMDPMVPIQEFSKH